jgi:hypothetical protein
MGLNQRFYRALRLSSAEPCPLPADAPSGGLGISHTGQARGRHRQSIADKRGWIG